MIEMTAELARRLWDYDAETGIITWKVSPRNGVRVGDVAGSLKRNGYLRVRFDGKGYPLHRLAWLIATGTWPSKDLDHLNGIRDDNRLVNLREATRRQNQQNAKCHRGGQLRFTTFYKRYGKWRAQSPLVDGKRKNLGCYDTMEEASKVVECWLAENCPELV